MERDREHKSTPPPTPPRNNKSANIVGAIIVFLGLALLLKNLNMGIWFPRWIFGWEMILIIIGLVIGVNSRFEKKSSVILIAIGGLFLLKDLTNLSFMGVILPLGAIIIGIYLILKNRNQSANLPPTPPTIPSNKDEFDWDKRVNTNQANDVVEPLYTPFQTDEPGSAHTTNQGQSQGERFQYEGENYIKIDSVFGHARKVVFSKSFLGGTLTNVFGSTEINLLQADMPQPVALDVFQLFGSTKIIVPPHWVVVTTVSSILSENDDRRVILTKIVDQNKSLYITGTSIFGNITIKNS
ncbi:hypothetical protein HP439_09810 [Sphingobacterium shayense]|uniref:LiaF transmembrane domain-containing protein n=1 Tax=Sphingobacterium shayense TaxID=626343 RepID=UPI001553E96F|nr:hypothetical protein [Sphingobacterium shayense]NQD71012.1 hypothetical protein [Sphingobacterium shayense]